LVGDIAHCSFTCQANSHYDKTLRKEGFMSHTQSINGKEGRAEGRKEVKKNALDERMKGREEQNGLLLVYVCIQ
jgi:hypothetical protein